MPRGVDRWDEARLQGRLWTPALMSSLAGWWDASDLSTMSFATGISEWRSKIGGVAVSQATGATQPTWSAAARNGLPGVNFNGSQYLTVAGAPSGFVTGTSAMSLMVVGYLSGTSGYRVPVVYGLTDTTGLTRETGSAPGGAVYAGTSGSAVSTSAAWNATDRLVCVVFPSGTSITLSIYIDGTLTTGSVSVGNVSSGFTIGTKAISTNNITGTLNEVLFFNAALTLYEVQRVQAYCAWKWKMDRILATNPFKNRPPLIGD